MNTSKAILIGIYGLFASLPLFLMYITLGTEVLDAQFSEQAFSDSPINYFVVLCLLGFGISILSQIIAILLISNMRNKQYLTIAALSSGIINIIFWILVSLFYYSFYDHASFFEKVMNWGKGLSYFTIFELGGIGLLFLYSQLTYTLFFILFTIFYKNQVLEVRYK